MFCFFQLPTAGERAQCRGTDRHHLSGSAGWGGPKRRYIGAFPEGWRGSPKRPTAWHGPGTGRCLRYAVWEPFPALRRMRRGRLSPGRARWGQRLHRRGRRMRGWRGGGRAGGGGHTGARRAAAGGQSLGRPLAAGCDDVTAAGRARAGRRGAAESVSGRSARPGAAAGAAGQGGAGRGGGGARWRRASPPPPPPHGAPRHCHCGRLRARGLPGRLGPARPYAARGRLREWGRLLQATGKPVAASGAGGCRLGLAVWGRLAGSSAGDGAVKGARPPSLLPEPAAVRRVCEETGLCAGWGGSCQDPVRIQASAWCVWEGEARALRKLTVNS